MKRILAAVLSTVVSTSVFAAPPVTNVESGPYAGFTVGRAHMENPFIGSTTVDDKKTVGSILLGYQYTKNWGIEAFYGTIGQLDAIQGTNTGTADADAFGLNVVGTAPLNDAFSLYGKLGFARTKTDASSAPPQIQGRHLSNATGGLGGQFNVNKNTGIRLGVDRYRVATLSGNTPGAEDKFWSDVWSVGLIFKF
jgi:OOP family OmpA-OmpF porin